MKKKIASFIPFVIRLAFLLPVIHTVFFYAPTYSYDGSQGLFCCGLIPVENSSFRWGYADKQGRKVMMCIYDEASDFDSAERAIVRKGENEYLIDTAGKYIGNSPYESVFACERTGYYIVKKGGMYKDIDRNGRSILKNNYDCVHDCCKENYLCVELDGKYGLIDYDENIVIPFEYDDNIYDWEGYLYTKKNGRKGIINYDNEIVVPFLYDSVSVSKFGYKEVTGNNYYGLLDADNNLFVDLFYESLTIETPDRFIAEKNERCGVIDKDENIIVPFEYDDIRYNSEDKSWDATCGKEMLKLDYDGGLIRRYDEKEIIYSPNGIVDEERLKELDKLYGLDNGTHIVCYNGESAYHVEKGGKYGLMDTHSGEMIIPPVSDKLIYFINGYAAVYEDRKIRFIDKNNNTLFTTEGDYVNCYSDDKIRIYNYDTGKCNVLDKEFNELFTIKASYISRFEDDGYAVFTEEKYDDDYGVVDGNGRIMFKPKYMGISWYNDDGA
ncbi:MAG: WG repeat-containing protein [Ruminococcus sp.]|uniref:WG repeat-containing protein n=1 Tax=Ruminococcus sp. TaxID=41978 RepID=UPI0025E3416D|nr:WG repeat-containing protein [Ruminococcus sp.]MCR5600679.1 WG repeat-containing protein [Ruminococcus sp.]